METRTLMILGARRAQLPAIRTALEMGLRVVAVDPDAAAPGLVLATVGSVHDLADLDAILNLARAENIGGILTLGADYPMPTVASVCAALSLPGPSPEVVLAATNKRLMRMALEKAGVPCPRHHHVQDLKSAKSALADLATDAIFKPAMSQGGRGITRVAANSPPAFIEQAYHRAQEETRADGVMVEEFIDGPEFSVESLSYEEQHHIVAITDKLTSGTPHYVEIGHNQPSQWPRVQVEALCQVATEALHVLGIAQAAGHTELRLATQGPVIMEVAARLGGGFINSHLVPLSTGVDILAAAIRVALGDTPDLTPHAPPRGAAIRFMHTQPGKIKHIEGVDTLKGQEGVSEVEVYVQPGDWVAPLLDARNRLGHVICHGPDAGQAIHRAEQALHNVRIETSGDVQA